MFTPIEHVKPERSPIKERGPWPKFKYGAAYIHNCVDPRRVIRIIVLIICHVMSIDSRFFLRIIAVGGWHHRSYTVLHTEYRTRILDTPVSHPTGNGTVLMLRYEYTILTDYYSTPGSGALDSRANAWPHILPTRVGWLTGSPAQPITGWEIQ